MNFTVCQLQEKCMAFIDLTKAFAAEDRQALWCILSRLHCHDKYIKTLRPLHDDMSATVLNNSGSVSESFRVEAVLKQGCIIAPTLFSIFIAVILLGNELLQGVHLVYRTDGKLFNLNKFKAKSKIRYTIIMEL